MRRTLIALVALLVALVPSAALAHSDEEHDDDGDAIEIRVNGFYHLEGSETTGTVVVVNDDALVEGTIEDLLVVVNGEVVLVGTVEGDVIVINGSLEMVELASVEDDVILISSDITRDPATTVDGDIDVRSGWFLTGGAGFLIGFVLWVWFAVAALVVATLFAAIAGRQLNGSVNAMVERPGYTWLAVVLLWVMGGTVVTALFTSIVGIGAALAMVILFTPILVLFGFVITGALVGRFVVGLFGRTPAEEHPYLSVLSGVAILALVALVPVVGALVAFLATLWGTGALAHQGWRSFRGPESDTKVEAAPVS